MRLFIFLQNSLPIKMEMLNHLLIPESHIALTVASAVNATELTTLPENRLRACISLISYSSKWGVREMNAQTNHQPQDVSVNKHTARTVLVWCWPT